MSTFSEILEDRDPTLYRARRILKAHGIVMPAADLETAYDELAAGAEIEEGPRSIIFLASTLVRSIKFNPADADDPDLAGVAR